MPKTGQVIVFEVHGDIAASISGPQPVTLATRFNTGSVFAQAEWISDGAPLVGMGTKSPAGQYEPSDGTYVDSGAAGQIQTQVQYSTVYTIRNQGDLYIAQSTVPVHERQLLGGALKSEILRLTTHAEYEDIDVTFMVFTATGADASSFATNIQRLELYLAGGVTPFAIATVGGCGTDPVPANSMCAEMNNQEFIVPKGANVDVLVRPKMTTDVDGAVSSQDVRIRVGPEPIFVQARGMLSSNDLDPNDGDSSPEGEVFIGRSSAGGPNLIIKSRFNEVVLSKVTSITNADPNANGTFIPTGNNRDIAQFKFATAPANNTKNGTNKWTLKDILFNLNATNVLIGSGDQTNPATSDFEIYNKADPTMISRCTANVATASGASLLVTCPDITDSGVNSSIDPGTDITFVLRTDIINNKINGSALSVLQASFTSFANPFATFFSSASSHIRWLDKDNATSPTTFLWIEHAETTINGTQYNA